MKNILITGAAGFIGGNLTLKLLAANKFTNVIGVDNMSSYYDAGLKNYRIGLIDAQKNSAWQFFRGDIADKNFVDKIFAETRPEIVVNLAAQAGVRYSTENPDAYIQSNIVGFFNVLETCRNFGVAHFIYASSSSVYGGNKKIPFATTDRVDSPISLYAATKKSDELLAHCYGELYGLKDGLAIFHGLRRGRASRHGVFQIHEQTFARRRNSDLQFRKLRPRFYLRRRHCRRTLPRD